MVIELKNAIKGINLSYKEKEKQNWELKKIKNRVKTPEHTPTSVVL